MSTRKLVALLLFVAGVTSAVLLASGGRKPPVPVERSSSAEPPRYFGWINDPAAVRECAADLDCRPFRETEAFSAEDDQPENVYMWDAARKATGDVLPARDQK